MSLENKNLSILSEAEQAALYELPDFDDAQRLTYLNFNPEEMKLIYRGSSREPQKFPTIYFN